MTGIERLRKLAGDLHVMKLWFILTSGTEGAHGVASTSNVTLTERLREIADQIERERDVCDREEHEAASWVREHGGVEAISARLMPEGCEWPRYEDGEPVKFGDRVSVEVHDEDGDFERTMTISGIKFERDGLLIEGEGDEIVMCSPHERFRRPPALDADGAPINVGDTVWLDEKHRDMAWKSIVESHGLCGLYGVDQFEALTVKSLGTFADPIVTFDEHSAWCPASWLTHAEPDSWERIERDAKEISQDIAEFLGDYSKSDFRNPEDSLISRVSDLVRRCKALAGVSER